jgi:putative mRNA 3-end processing factor
MKTPLIEETDRGLYCPRGGFHIDPWSPVERAVVTHGHADHARPGATSYLTAADGVEIVRARTGAASIEGLPYGEARRVGDVTVSLHPAGHCLGAAQVRIEADGVVWVVSGDYRPTPDATCVAFEPVPCDVFVTETTFALPIFRWSDPRAVLEEIETWWRDNRAAGVTSVLCAYALGKAQRVIAALEERGPIVLHGAVARYVDIYRAAGVYLPETLRVDDDGPGADAPLVVAPPGALGSPWLRRFGPVSTAFVSGWMHLRGARRRRNVERGFVLSDHADWPGVLETVRATGAGHVIATHGFADALARYLRETGGCTTEVWSARPAFVPGAEEDA